MRLEKRCNQALRWGLSFCGCHRIPQSLEVWTLPPMVKGQACCSTLSLRSFSVWSSFRIFGKFYLSLPSTELPGFLSMEELPKDIGLCFSYDTLICVCLKI